MIEKKMNKFSKAMRRTIIIGTIIAILNMAFALAMEKDDPTQLVLMMSWILFGLIILISVKTFFTNKSRYKKLCQREGERGMELLNAEYQAGRKTKEAVFGDKHLFLEPDSVDFDIIDYQEIFWMYLYQHTTTVLFIPVIRIRYICIYLDAPERGNSQLVHINAKRLHRNDALAAFFAAIKEKNPNILLGHDAEWHRMLSKDKEALIRLAHNQTEAV